MLKTMQMPILWTPGKFLHVRVSITGSLGTGNFSGKRVYPIVLGNRNKRLRRVMAWTFGMASVGSFLGMPPRAGRQDSIRFHSC
jgi:hypothetical protein